MTKPTKKATTTERSELVAAIGSLHDQIKEKDREHRFHVAELEAEVARLRRALKQQKPADDDVHALVRGLKALAKGTIVVVPPKKKPRKKP